MRKVEFGVLAMLLLVVVATAIREPRFLGADSLSGILLYVPLLVIVGMGQMLVIVTRGIDVSVGSIVGVAGLVVGMTFRAHPGMNVLLGLLEGLGAGLVLGGLNAAVIAWGRVPPIVATLGTLSAYRGLGFIVSGGKQVSANDLPEGLVRLASDGPIHLGKAVLPWSLFVALLVAGATAFFVRDMTAGRAVYALGGNPEAARLRGLPVVRTTALVYAVSGALAGLAGVLFAARYGTVNPGSAGVGLELSVIAAVVVGGTRVTGGAGSVVGVLLGCLLLATIGQALAALPFGLGLGTALGAVNGLLVARLRLPSFMVTFATMAAYRGLAQVLVGTQSARVPAPLTGLDLVTIPGTPIPAPLVVFVLAAVAIALVRHRTVFGRRLVAVGTNERAAFYAGVPTARTTIGVFALSGFLAGLAGLLIASRLGVARYDHGRGTEVDAIVAVVLGGASIAGGSGTIAGTVLALLLVGLLRTDMGLANVTAEYQLAAIGALLIGAVLLGKKRTGR